MDRIKKIISLRFTLLALQSATSINVTDVHITSLEISVEHDDPHAVPLKISWIPPKTLNTLVVDPAGVLTLNDAENQQYLYVARANYRDGIIPGYWNPALQMMIIGNMDKEEIVVPTKNVDVLHMPKGSTSWVRVQKEQELFNMVLGGVMPGNKTLLYVCRVIMPGNNLVVGYREEYEKKCVAFYAGEQVAQEDYEMLCITGYGMISGAFV